MRKTPETVVLLGFSHSEGFSGAAIMDGDSFSTPLTSTLLDSDAAAILSEGRDRIARHGKEKEAAKENDCVCTLV